LTITVVGLLLTDGLFAVRERVVNSTSVEQTVKQLKPSTSYEFRVVAWNSQGPSDQAARTELVTLPQGLYDLLGGGRPIVFFLLYSLITGRSCHCCVPILKFAVE